MVKKPDGTRHVFQQRSDYIYTLWNGPLFQVHNAVVVFIVAAMALSRIGVTFVLQLSDCTGVSSPNELQLNVTITLLCLMMIG